ncbi:MAG: signal transduction histidine kinase, LytS [Gemmatimonadetes bacterium]|nr:signal transduction histidine kinase, LytS [Gemmatimonadota bacterium]
MHTLPVPAADAATPGGSHVRIPPLALFVFATLIGLIGGWQHVEGMTMAGHPAPYAHGMAMRIPYWYVWALSVPLLQWFVRRVPIDRHRWLPAVALHLGVAVAVTLVSIWLILGVQMLLPAWVFSMGSPFPRDPFPFLWRVVLSDLPLYVVLLGLAYLVEYYGRYRDRELAASELRGQLVEAQLQALRMQLNPHFLFNAMNTIAMLVRGERSSEAVRMLAGLSDLLRSVLEEKPPLEVPLRDELAFLERYLAIERVRCADRLRVDVRVAPELMDAGVPNLILQPLVENAIKHGVAPRTAATLVRIAAERRDGTLLLSVRDDGPGPEPNAGDGVGLRNTRARLARMYGDEQSLELTEAEGGGALATISLPYRRAGGRAEWGGR